MSDAHGKDTMRRKQPQTDQIPQNEVLAALSTGGGIFPSAGRYSAKVWAIMLGCSAKTVYRYIEEHDIPYRRPGGGEMIIEANDFWTSLPVLKPSTDRKKGGNQGA